MMRKCNFNIATFILSQLFVLHWIHNNCSAQSIAAGSQQSLFLCSNGIPMGCGNNSMGGLGNGTTGFGNIYINPIPAGSLNGIVAVASGGYHSLYLKNDGTVWGCGLNGSGELGQDTDVVMPSPFQVNGLSNIIAISTGESHSLFLQNDGTVWASGYNDYGQLGDGSIINRLNAVQLNSLTNIIAVSAGYNHSLFLKNDGTVWACGWNADGEFGNGTTTFSSTPVQTIGLTGNVTAISAGANHSLFLKDDGTVWACGGNSNGALGDGTTIQRNIPVQVNSLNSIVAISAGSYSLFLKTDSTVWGCGWNGTGPLGDGSMISRTIPVQASSLSGITAISAKWQHSLFLKSDSSVWACGGNFFAQLACVDTNLHPTPIKINNLCQVAEVIGIEETVEEQNISIQPNPFNTSTKILFDRQIINGALEVYNLHGERIESVKNISGQSIILHRNNLPTGFYFVVIREGNKIITHKKIIIDDH